jgi:energy-coupling factor transport system substrate-specific component
MTSKEAPSYKLAAVVVAIIVLAIALYGTYSFLSFNWATGPGDLLVGKGWSFGQAFLNLGFDFWLGVGGIVWLAGTILFLMELGGVTLEGLKLRRFSLRWDAVDIATTALCAAVYGGGLFATGGLTVIPGFTWIRPANALTPIFGILFGLPGAFGCAIGNFIADAFAGFLSVGSIGGFVGNFILAWVPYKFVKDASMRSGKSWAQFYLWGVLVGSVWCAIYIGWWLYFIGPQSPVLASFPLTGLPAFLVWGYFTPFVVINNAIVTAIVSAPVTAALFPYAKKWGLYWGDRIRYKS